MKAEEREEVTPAQSELDIQKSFMEKMRPHTTGKLYTIHTYGCQMNERDSEKIAGMLNEMGYTKTEDEKKASLIIFNTCCVRENAENRLYGNLGHIKKLKDKNKDLKVIVCGCMVQQDIVLDKIRQSYRFVDIIFGTFNFYRLPQLLHDNKETGQQIIDIWKEHAEIIEDLPSQRVFSFKAGVNIMYGCNNHCSFCIVPYVRGRERSRQVSDITQEIKELVADGVKEIMLLGQNVNSYGKTLEPKVTFAQLLQEVNKIDGLERIRFMSSHPKDLSDELIDTMAECSKVCKHYHLPVQSGSSRLLKEMRRFYTKEDYLNIVKKLRERMPNIIITTDIIVGFPGETEEDNDETIDIINKAQFSNAFTYIYSKREGTPAAAIEEQVPEPIAKERFNKVIATLKPITEKINQQQIGTTQTALVESISKNDPNILSGRLENSLLVHFKGDKSQIGQLVDVKITDCKTFYLIGETI